mmetsp:Transcript_26748/g.63432  ORF Transcript_26748/g.63432 Transcript_26748/m.63432 type:complete len:213 (-) Transcript_26748:322-960(-)
MNAPASDLLPVAFEPVEVVQRRELADGHPVRPDKDSVVGRALKQALALRRAVVLAHRLVQLDADPKPWREAANLPDVLDLPSLPPREDLAAVADTDPRGLCRHVLGAGVLRAAAAALRELPVQRPGRVLPAALLLVLPEGAAAPVIRLVRHHVLLHLAGVLQPPLGRQRRRVGVHDVECAPVVWRVEAKLPTVVLETANGLPCVILELDQHG